MRTTLVRVLVCKREFMRVGRPAGRPVVRPAVRPASRFFLVLQVYGLSKFAEECWIKALNGELSSRSRWNV